MACGGSLAPVKRTVRAHALRATADPGDKQTFLLFLVALLTPVSATTQRIALVVDDAADTDRPLRNPVNDARLTQTTCATRASRHRWPVL